MENKEEILKRMLINDLYDFEDELSSDISDDEKCKTYIKDIEEKINLLMHDIV
ncbi:MAG: hypothetical protein ACOCWM_05330 [Cyclobacteriaceae bacterium]